GSPVCSGRDTPPATAARLRRRCLRSRTRWWPSHRSRHRSEWPRRLGLQPRTGRGPRSPFPAAAQPRSPECVQCSSILQSKVLLPDCGRPEDSRRTILGAGLRLVAGGSILGPRGGHISLPARQVKAFAANRGKFNRTGATLVRLVETEGSFSA